MRAHTYAHLLYFLSHQTAGCLRSRNQCLLDSLDWGPPLPSDSRVIIGPANTDEHSHVGIQEDTDSDYTNKQLQDRSLQWRRRYRPCSQYVLYAWVICLSFKHWVAYAYRYIGELTRTGGGDWDQGEHSFWLRGHAHAVVCHSLLFEKTVMQAMQEVHVRVHAPKLVFIV